MVSDKQLANAVGGKTARCCDNCIRKRARWFCPADDAFLCQSCDASVHSANPLASRHERVRLKTASLRADDRSHLESFVPFWQKGFTRKARTPRHKKHSIHGSASSEGSIRNPLPFVPEVGTEEGNSHEENEEQLLYRVPIFDPFTAELCMSTTSNNAATMAAVSEFADDGVGGDEFKALSQGGGNGMNITLHGFLPSDLDPADFEADVETLLGKGLDEESFDMEKLGILDCKDHKDSLMEGSLEGRVKIEEEEEEEEELELGLMGNQLIDSDIDLTRVSFEFNFDYESSPQLCGEEQEDDDEKVGNVVEDYRGKDEKKKKKKKKEKEKEKEVLLRLDYEGVIAAWADQRSPWTTGDRPELVPNDCWPDCMGTCGTIHMGYGEIGGVMGGQSSNSIIMADGGREARVSRYREKRRTRLFSKKIRYEVRKLNAEKRPRMKGRFVKRSSNFAGSTN